MIKNYQDFIFERFYPNTFSMHWEDLINIYKDQIVPKIGEITQFQNQMLGGVLDKSIEAHFHQLRVRMIDYRSEFAQTLIDLDRFYGKSFSSLAGSSSDPEKDFQEMQSLLNRAGYTLEVLKKLFDSDICKLINQSFKSFIRIYSLDDKNGYIDLYLYKLNEVLDLSTKVYLGGDGWSDALNEFPDDEYIVKYSYGYHKTLYGQLFLKQLGISNEKFVENAYEYLRKYLNDQVFLSLLSDLRKKFSNQGIDFDFDKYLTLDDDRFIISYYEMYNDFHSKFGGENLNPEWFKERILLHMRVISHLEIQDTGDDLIFQD
jgi:hypothetical protein